MYLVSTRFRSNRGGFKRRKLRRITPSTAQFSYSFRAPRHEHRSGRCMQPDLPQFHYFSQLFRRCKMLSQLKPYKNRKAAHMPFSDSTCRIALMGACPDTGNLGVNALARSTMLGIHARIPRSEICIFDNGRGIRQAQYRSGEGNIRYQLCGLINSRRVYRRESIINMQVSAMLGGLGNPGLGVLANSNAVLDISGGDSFTDLYGKKRFDLICKPKALVLKEGRPLILLPQTYGPFKSPAAGRTASEIVRRASSAWARDNRSFEILKDLLGNDFDEDIHRCGVDVAFLLPAQKPVSELAPKIGSWFKAGSPQTIGINVSGLIYNNPRAARTRYGFKADYPSTVQALIKKILADSDCNVLLVPHVQTPKGDYESDVDACSRVYALLSADEKQRVAVLSDRYSESEIKWVISKLAWFCGTRMHSTIASLSSGVATTTIAYSDKALGVFASCAQQAEVLDPRHLDTADLVDATYDSFCRREKLAAELRSTLPSVLQRAGEQMDSIASRCVELVK